MFIDIQHMPREVTILTLLQEIKYLKLELLNQPEFHFVGCHQFWSNRPTCPKGVYTSEPEPPD